MTYARLRDILLVLLLTFPIIGTFFPVEGYFSASSSFAATNTGSATISTYVIAALLACALAVIARNPAKAALAVKRNWPLAAFLLWCFITALWSPDPAFSFNRTLRMTLFAGVALYMLDTLGLRHSVRLLLTAIALAQLLSLLAILLLPALAMALDARGAWHGALPHKNALGTLSTIAIVANLIAWRTKTAKPLNCLALATLLAILLGLANAVAALAALAAALTVTLYALTCLRGAPTQRLLALILLGAAATLALLATPSIETALYDIIGRDPTLTGRSQVWAFTTAMIEQRPLWGFGHGIWNDPQFRQLTLATLGWPSPHAHNLWLDLRLQLGWPGLLLVALIMLIALRQSIMLLLFRPPGLHLLPIAILLIMAVRSTAETLIVEPDLGGMFWLTFASAAIAQTWRETHRQRRQTAADAAFQPVTPNYWGP